MKNILLLDTSIATFNQGDEIINISLQKNWKELFESHYMTQISSHQPVYSLFQTICYSKRFEFLKNADYKFLVGTNALYTNMARPLPNWNIRLWNTKLISDTVCVGVGIGENSKHVNWYTKKLYQKVLSPKYVHSTRDQKTCDFLISLGFRAVNTGCPTIWGLTPEFCAQIPKSKSEKVVFTLTSSFPNKNDKLMIDILCRNYKEVNFWAQNYNDLGYMKSIKGNNEINVIAPNVRAFSALLSQEIDYVGNRLHGGIFSLQHKCRTIIIAIDYRAREMNRNFELGCIEREDLANELEMRIQSNWETQIVGLDTTLIEEWKSQFSI